MGSLNGRMRRLEERYGAGAEPEERDRRIEEKRAELRARLQRIIEEKGEIEPWRQAAIEELRKSIERRRAHES